jgi:hypothetical protein
MSEVVSSKGGHPIIQRKVDSASPIDEDRFVILRLSAMQSSD